jgi:hypothetical protein
MLASAGRIWRSKACPCNLAGRLNYQARADIGARAFRLHLIEAVSAILPDDEDFAAESFCDCA